MVEPIDPEFESDPSDASGGSGSGLPALPDDDVDFAGEHDETSYADNVPGGPERAAEEETPRGHAGMD
jgi:hypothetical protein